MPALWFDAGQLPATCGLLLLMAAILHDAIGLVPSSRGAGPLEHHVMVAGDSLQEMRDGYWWYIVTPVLCHSDLGHFLYNSLFFYAYALPLERELGPAPLVALFFGSHVAGAASSSNCSSTASVTLKNTPSSAVWVAPGRPRGTIARPSLPLKASLQPRAS
jgi:membrane associated rhomboid family serine protease